MERRAGLGGHHMATGSSVQGGGTEPERSAVRSPASGGAQGSKAAGTEASGAPGHVQPASHRPGARSTRSIGPRFSTRCRLFLAFSGLAALFAVAFWSQVAGLRKIEGRLGELQEHDEQARLTLELENAIRSQFVHEAHFIVGED